MLLSGFVVVAVVAFAGAVAAAAAAPVIVAVRQASRVALHFPETGKWKADRIFAVVLSQVSICVHLHVRHTVRSSNTENLQVYR